MSRAAKEGVADRRTRKVPRLERGRSLAFLGKPVISVSQGSSGLGYLPSHSLASELKNPHPRSLKREDDFPGKGVCVCVCVSELIYAALMQNGSVRRATGQGLPGRMLPSF